MTKSSRFLFLGGRLCLDFVNTEIVLRGEPLDLLPDFKQWMAWHSAASGPGTNQERAQAREWQGKVGSADAYASAIAFRSELRKMAKAMASNKTVPDSAVAAVNDVLRRGAAYEQVIPSGRGFARRAYRAVHDPADLLVPVAEDAADLLCEGNRGRVRKCENPACILFFHDQSRNGTRRWCSMDLCGNRAKAAAHYRRQRAR